MTGWQFSNVAGLQSPNAPPLGRNHARSPPTAITFFQSSPAAYTPPVYTQLSGFFSLRTFSSNPQITQYTHDEHH